MESYSKLKLRYSIKREELPKLRKYSTTTKSLLWIAASSSKSIDDFNQRIIGVLPHQTQSQFITLLKKAESYYNDLLWNKEQDNVYRIQNQLDDYKNQINDLYLKTSNFYNTTWNIKIPFKISLYPIPLKIGNTTATAKGNTLICGFMSHNENEYKAQLGIIMHEMCHILYKEQDVDFQHQLDKWFKNSASPYAPLAYSFIDEGLATALGNGWAYKQIHKSIDPAEWYNNKHINGFGHALFPLVEQYINDGKSIDQDFVNKSIELFAQKFPKAIKETAILMNNLQVFSNNTKDIDEIADNLYDYFNIRSMSFLTPILSIKSKKAFDKIETTKLFVINSDNENSIIGLQKTFFYPQNSNAHKYYKYFKR